MIVDQNPLSNSQLNKADDILIVDQGGYFKDLHIKPNEKDLLSANLFMERTLDAIE